MRLQAAALLSCLALAACGGPATAGTSPDASAPPAADAAAAAPPSSGAIPPSVAIPPAPPAPPPPTAALGPPGTSALSHNFGDAALQVGAGSGLYYLDLPQAGEARIAGFVLVQDMTGRLPAPPPADVVVSLNGVALVRMTLNGAPSDRFFVVDPSGPQPTISADGFLRVTATSASLRASRTLELACPDAVSLASNPAAGASLAGATAMALAFGSHLPFNPPTNVTPGAFLGPSVSLYALDAATGALSAAPLDTRPIDQGALGAALLVHPTAATGYLAELRFPGIVFLDNLTGGFCGRTTRLVYAN